MSWGCQEFLEEEPEATIVADSYYSNEDEVLQGLIGAYDVLGLERTYDLNLWRLGSGGGDNFIGNTGAMEVVEYTFGADAAIFRDTWSELYNGINRANLLIANVPNTEGIAPEVAARYIAEAKFIRALCYFNLVNLFGGVPLVETPLNPQELKIPRNSVEEVYTLIEEDLKAGAEVLPTDSELGSEGVGRASRGAAQSLLAKAYLFQEEWADAAAQASEVIASGEYELVESYRNIFLLENEDNAEIIFQIIFSRAGPQGWGDENEGNQFSQWFRPVCKGGWGNPMPTESLEETYEPGDERFKATIVEAGDQVVEPEFKFVSQDYVLQPGETFNEDIGTIDCEGWGKWWLRDGQIQADQGPLNWIVIRLADVILVRAEALAEMNQLNEAVLELNKVRQRANLPDVSITTQQALIDAVRLERRVELAAEGTRLYDLRRWGIVIEALQAVDKPVEANKHELFPIPQTEVDLHEGAMEQNPNW